LRDDLPAIVWHLDEPYGGGLPSWLVFKAMSESFKVGLTGTGGDELFGNYGKWRGLEEAIPTASNRTGEVVDRAAFRSQFFDHHYYLGDADKRALMIDGAPGCIDTSEFLYERFASAGGGVRDRVAVTDMTTQLPDEFLMMTDRLSMAHGLEARTPFLDNEMVDLALSIPASLRTNPDDLKGLLRRAVAPLLPPEIQTAPKRGFVVPLGLWIRGLLRPLCEHFLSPRRLREQGLLSPAFHARYVKPHLDGTADHTSRVWSMLMFQLWHDTFIDHTAAPDPDG
jgi:asparagine synthase (glutamine-hydrolysing)